MNKNTLLLLALSAMLISGCSTSVETLNKQHTPVTIVPRVVTQSAWTVDKASFAAAAAIEVLPTGGSDNDHSMVERARGDFTAVFESNAAQLMSSLFGNEKANVPRDQAEYVLQIQIGKGFIKMGMFAWQESQTEIELTFKLMRRQGGKDVAIAPVTVTGRATGNTGNLYTFHDNAHKRANLAINTAFTDAQKGLIEALSRQ